MLKASCIYEMRDVSAGNPGELLKSDVLMFDYNV